MESIPVLAEYAQNSHRQPSTKLTPIQCVLCYQPPLFPWSGELSNVLSVVISSERVRGSAVGCASPKESS